MIIPTCIRKSCKENCSAHNCKDMIRLNPRSTLDKIFTYTFLALKKMYLLFCDNKGSFLEPPMYLGIVYQQYFCCIEESNIIIDFYIWQLGKCAR